MIQLYLPDIGATGNYTLKTPFNVLVKPQVSYTCKAIRKLSDLIADGLDPFELIYNPVDILQSIYDQELKDDVCIISLQTGDGEWLHIPNNYIIKFPNMNGIVYRAMMLGISLGALPDTLNLDALKTAMTNLVYDNLGVTSVVKEVVISVPSIISKVDHDLIETARLSKVSLTMSDSGLLGKAQNDLDKARIQIANLEEFIKTKLGLDIPDA